MEEFSLFPAGVFNLPGDQIIAWAREAQDAWVKLRSTCGILPTSPDAGIDQFNLMLDQRLAFCAINEKYGLNPTQDDFKKFVISIFTSSPKKKISFGEHLSIAASAFHENNYRLSTAGTKDSRMAAATVAAYACVRAVKKLPRGHDEQAFVAAFDSEVRRIIDNPKTDDGQEAAYAAGRKAIGRHKKSILTSPLIWLNPETFRVEIVAPERRLHGMPRGRGRPRKSK